MNIPLVISVIVFGIVASIIIYMTPAMAEDIPPITMEECYEETGDMMAIAGKYIVREATAQRLITDLKDIIRDKDIEIAKLKKN